MVRLLSTKLPTTEFSCALDMLCCGIHCNFEMERVKYGFVGSSLYCEAAFHLSVPVSRRQARNLKMRDNMHWRRDRLLRISLQHSRHRGGAAIKPPT